ncbi:MAG TPA: hypothetical protein VN873_05030 [Candidatus Angelobacter sp.]|nr:hypothetical protein [Candidatus Angelobacter sp.]
MKTANRASRNAGKKTPSSQSANTTKKAAVKPAADSVYFTLIEGDGEVINNAKIPHELAERLSAAVAGVRTPLAPLPAGTINIGPISGGRRRNAAAFPLQISLDVESAIIRAFGDDDIRLGEALRRAVITALRLAEKPALLFPGSGIEETVQTCEALLDLFASKLIADAGEAADSRSADYEPQIERRLVGQITLIQNARKLLRTLDSQACEFSQGWRNLLEFTNHPQNFSPGSRR